MDVRRVLCGALIAVAATGGATAGSARGLSGGAAIGHAVVDGQVLRLVAVHAGETRTLTVATPAVAGSDATPAGALAAIGDRAPDDVRWFGGDRAEALAAAGLDQDAVAGWSIAGRYTVEPTADGTVTTVVVGPDTVRLDVPRTVAERAAGWERSGVEVRVNDAVAWLDGSAYRRAATEPLPLVPAAWVDPRGFGLGVRALGLLTDAARRNTPLDVGDCTWECMYCGGLWVTTGITATVTVIACPTVIGCIAGAIGTVTTLGAAVNNCLECDRCLHPAPDPGTDPEPAPACPDGFAACSPNSTLCCELPHCPPGFAPCDHDPMVCCSDSECWSPDCPYP